MKLGQQRSVDILFQQPPLVCSLTTVTTCQVNSRTNQNMLSRFTTALSLILYEMYSTLLCIIQRDGVWRSFGHLITIERKLALHPGITYVYYRFGLFAVSRWQMPSGPGSQYQEL